MRARVGIVGVPPLAVIEEINRRGFTHILGESGEA